MSRHDLALAQESCRGHGIFSPLLTTNVCITCHIGSNCPGISGTVPDYKNLSRVPERYVKCPGSRQENCKGSVAIIVSNKYAMM